MSENIQTLIEDQLSSLGFDAKNITSSLRYTRNDYAIIQWKFNLNDNNYQDQVHIEFGVNCTKNGVPKSIHNMDVQLIKSLNFSYYHNDKGLPTKDEILSEMKKALRVYETSQQTKTSEANERIAHAKEIQAKVNEFEHNNYNRLRKKS